MVATGSEESAVVTAEIIGPDLLIIFLIVALLFGSSQVPKLARSLGQSSKEFRRGLMEDSEGPPSQKAGQDT